MPDSVEMMHALDARVRRREERREFFKTALSAGVMAAGGLGALGLASAADAQTAPSDTDILNFALNLEYLEAQFYSYAVNGTGLASNLLDGSQTQGTLITTSGAGNARAVDFTGEPAIQQYAREIAADELAHVNSLRAALGSAKVAMPTIDISVQTFTAFANAAGISGTFDPYANVNNFLLGAFVFEDVGVTAYKGAAPLLTNVDIIDSAAGILAAEAFHAGIIRGQLYRRGVATPTLRTTADQISDERDTLDGTTAQSGPPMLVADDDQGISPVGTGATQMSNFVPTDANGMVFSRTTRQVHSIVYANNASATAGGFFPNGTNNPNAALRVSGTN